MRGELNMRNTNFGPGMTRGLLDITAPSTPGTASSIRTNPPVYQRMHSNDSNKDGASNGRLSDCLDNPSPVHALASSIGAKKYLNISNRFRRSSNPATPASRSSRFNNHNSPTARSNRAPSSSSSKAYAHRIGNSALPPLPPNTLNNRSHSLDGLLDSTTDACKSQWSNNDSTDEGLNEITFTPSNKSSQQLKTDSNESIRTSKNRRSKSLDDLIDEDDMLLMEDDRETQSMENIVSNESLANAASPDPSEKMCENEVITVDSSMHPSKGESIEDDSGIQSDTKLQSDTSDEDATSNTISLTSSTASERKSGKAFFNKYVKKVKNLMKK